jgi:glycosyltransferase involved in cell wall biosynthesis
VDHLLAAAAVLDDQPQEGRRLVVVGPGELGALWTRSLPRGVEVHNGLIGDKQTLDLFRRCGLLVLPYRDATQSALVGHAYYFRKPVIVTRTGALPEYVVEGKTGWLVPPKDPQALADALEEALSDPVRLARMGEAGREWYDRERKAEEMTLQQMYARLVGRQG